MADAENTTYSRAARLRVALSELAAEIADSARSMVPTASDSYAHGGEFAESAAQLAAQARELLTLAVAYERRRGSSWERIGEPLGTSRQSAQERFGEAVRGLDDAITTAWILDDPRTPGVPEGAGDPAETAARLDRWVLRHLEGTDPLAHRPDDDPARDRPVSASLDRMDVHDFTAATADAANLIMKRLNDRRQQDDGLESEYTERTRQLEIGVARRKIEMYERMIRDGDGDHWYGIDVTDLLAGARARLAELQGDRDQAAEIVDLDDRRGRTGR
jgi:hypothetical protein